MRIDRARQSFAEPAPLVAERAATSEPASPPLPSGASLVHAATRDREAAKAQVAVVERCAARMRKFAPEAGPARLWQALERLRIEHGEHPTRASLAAIPSSEVRSIFDPLLGHLAKELAELDPASAGTRAGSVPVLRARVDAMVAADAVSYANVARAAFAFVRLASPGRHHSGKRDSAERLLQQAPTSLIYPTHHALDERYFVRLAAIPVYAIGINSKSAVADGVSMVPIDFATHDYGHASIISANSDLGPLSAEERLAAIDATVQLAEQLFSLLDDLENELGPLTTQTIYTQLFQATHEAGRKLDRACLEAIAAQTGEAARVVRERILPRLTPDAPSAPVPQLRVEPVERTPAPLAAALDRIAERIVPVRMLGLFDRIALALRPELPDSVRATLSSDPDVARFVQGGTAAPAPTPRQQRAADPQATPEELAALGVDHDPEVRLAVVQNAATPDGIFVSVVEHAADRVRRGVGGVADRLLLLVATEEAKRRAA